jgi:hypothetical protein
VSPTRWPVPMLARQVEQIPPADASAVGHRQPRTRRRAGREHRAVVGGGCAWAEAGRASSTSRTGACGTTKAAAARSGHVAETRGGPASISKR